MSGPVKLDKIFDRKNKRLGNFTGACRPCQARGCTQEPEKRQQWCVQWPTSKTWICENLLTEIKGGWIA